MKRGLAAGFAVCLWAFGLVDALLPSAVAGVGFLATSPTSSPDCCVSLLEAKQVPQVPCPCLTTAAPLVDVHQVEVARVREAVLAAARQGVQEIQQAVGEQGSPWNQKIATSVTQSMTGFEPHLEQVGQEQFTFSKNAVDAEKATHPAEEQRVAYEDNQLAIHNMAEVKRAADRYGSAFALNKIANVSAPALEETFALEASTEQYRLQTQEFSHAAIASANMSRKVAAEAEAIAKKMPKEHLNEAQAFIRTVEEQAKLLADESSKSEDLSASADKVAAQAAWIAKHSLDRAKATQTTAAQALETAKATARRLSELHNEAEGAETKIGSVGAAGASA